MKEIVGRQEENKYVHHLPYRETPAYMSFCIAFHFTYMRLFLAREKRVCTSWLPCMVAEPMIPKG